MRPQVISKTGTGTSAWIPMDYKQNPFNVGIGVVVSGTVTYTVQHTFDDIFDPNVTPTAFDHAIVGEVGLGEKPAVYFRNLSPLLRTQILIVNCMDTAGYVLQPAFQSGPAHPGGG